MKVPKGKIPVVLTFDDGRPSQYRILPDGTLDPNCAVGLLVHFHHLHPDWPLAGSFYLIAGNDANGVPFDQEGMERNKCRELLRMGFEIGNHTYSHPNMAALTGRQIQREIGLCKRYLTKLIPGLTVDTLAVPYGILPTSKTAIPFLKEGRWGATSYKNVAILLFSEVAHVAWRLTPTADPYAVPRVAPSPGAIEQWVKELRAGGPIEPYVSAGG